MDRQPVPGPSHQVSWAPDPPNVHHTENSNVHADYAGGGGGGSGSGGMSENGWETLLLPKGTGPPPSTLTGSLDLISTFNLSPLYDQFLRPYLPETAIVPSPPGSPKGKEKATPDGDVDSKPTTPSAAPAAAGLGRLSLSLGGVKLGGGGEGANGVGGKGKKVKMDKTYSHLVADIPGRNNIKKDHHLFHLAMNPDVQPAHIQPFDATTLREAFSLVPGTIPGFDNLIWTNDGDTGKKKKKKKRPLDDGEATGSGTDGAGGNDGAKKKKRKGEGGAGATP